jgi:hypothetical protein
MPPIVSWLEDDRVPGLGAVWLASSAIARMTPAEANAVNVVLGYLVGKGDQPPSHVVKTLAGRARNASRPVAMRLLCVATGHMPTTTRAPRRLIPDRLLVRSHLPVM